MGSSDCKVWTWNLRYKRKSGSTYWKHFWVWRNEELKAWYVYWKTFWNFTNLYLYSSLKDYKWNFSYTDAMVWLCNFISYIPYPNLKFGIKCFTCCVKTNFRLFHLYQNSFYHCDKLAVGKLSWPIFTTFSKRSVTPTSSSENFRRGYQKSEFTCIATFFTFRM